MTRAFLPLLRNNIKVTFGLSRDVKQRKRELIIWGALCALFIPLLILVCVGIYFLSRNMTIDLIASTIASIMFASEVMVLFFGVKSVVSLLFFSQDNEFLMSLPATGLDIFLSKFVTIYLLHLGMALLIQLPIFITLGIGAAISNIGFYILAIVGGMLTPFVPLFVLIIFAIPLGYLISYFRKNNLIGTILVLLLFGGVFAGYYYLIFAMQNSLQSGSLNMAELQNAMKIMSYIIYPNTYLANSMITTGME
ncbi:MAG: hypothetical protein K2P12_03665, partial [Clostridia bacterium]|nr:hypothetical protein [Clostridia bacterium]